MELLIIAILLFGGYSASAPLRRYDKKHKIGLIHGPYGWKRSKGKGKLSKFGSAAEQNNDRAAYWKAKYHEAIRERNEAGMAAADYKKQLTNLGREMNKISKQIHGDREIMQCTHKHCMRAKAIMMNIMTIVRGAGSVRRAA